MFEELLPPLPPSPASTISLLKYQFNFLDMSSDKMVNNANANKSDGTAGALHSMSSNTAVPLSPGSCSELLGFCKEFPKDLADSKNPGFLNLHCECLDENIMVHPSVLSIIHSF